MFRNPFELSDELKTENKPVTDSFGRLGEDDEPDSEIADIKTPTKLASSVGDTGQNNRRDVAKTEQLLGTAGTLDLKKTDGPTGYWGARTSDATKVFQKKNGLKVDGEINPGGETIRALGKLAGQAIKVAQPKHTTTRHSGAGRNQLSKIGTLSRAVDPGLRRGDANGDGGNGLSLTDEAFSENQRAARYLASRNGIGDFSTFVIDGIETDGDKAIAETVDLYHQTAEINQPQADALIKKVMPDLSTEHAERLQSAIKPPEETEIKNTVPEAILNRPSMDEDGNWFDANNNPIPNPHADPRFHEAAAPIAAAPMVAPGMSKAALTALVASGVITAAQSKELQKALDDWATPTSPDIDPEERQRARHGQPRISAPPDVPNSETFPSDDDNTRGTIMTKPPTDQTPDTRPSPVTPDEGSHTTFPDQSDDPDINGAQILEAKSQGSWHSRVVPDRASKIAKKFNDFGIPVDTRNGVHVVEDDAWRHAIKRHSEDPIPLTTDDRERIPEVVRSGRIIEVGLNKQRNPIIVYAAPDGAGNWLHVVEEVRGANNSGRLGPTLAMKTAYKTKAPPK